MSTSASAPISTGWGTQMWVLGHVLDLAGAVHSAPNHTHTHAHTHTLIHTFTGGAMHVWHHAEAVGTNA